MWKQFKKEIIAGGLVIAVLSFALGCVFNDSMERSKYHTVARIDQGSDKGLSDQGPNPDEPGGRIHDRQGRRGGGPGNGWGNDRKGCQPGKGCPGNKDNQGNQDNQDKPEQQPPADDGQGDGSNQDQAPAEQPDDKNQNNVDDNKDSLDNNEKNQNDTVKNGA